MIDREKLNTRILDLCHGLSHGKTAKDLSSLYQVPVPVVQTVSKLRDDGRVYTLIADSLSGIGINEILNSPWCPVDQPKAKETILPRHWSLPGRVPDKIREEVLELYIIDRLKPEVISARMILRLDIVKGILTEHGIVLDASESEEETAETEKDSYFERMRLERRGEAANRVASLARTMDGPENQDIVKMYGNGHCMSVRAIANAKDRSTSNVKDALLWSGVEVAEMGSEPGLNEVFDLLQARMFSGFTAIRDAQEKHEKESIARLDRVAAVIQAGVDSRFTLLEERLTASLDKMQEELPALSGANSLQEQLVQLERRVAEHTKAVNDRLNAWSVAIDANIDQRHKCEESLVGLADQIKRVEARVDAWEKWGPWLPGIGVPDSGDAQATTTAVPEFPRPADVMQMSDALLKAKEEIKEHRTLIESLWNARAYGIPEIGLSRELARVMHYTTVGTRPVDTYGISVIPLNSEGLPVVPGCVGCIHKDMDLKQLQRHYDCALKTIRDLSNEKTSLECKVIDSKRMLRTLWNAGAVMCQSDDFKICVRAYIGDDCRVVEKPSAPASTSIPNA